MTKPEITWNDFEKLDIRTGTIITVSDFPKAIKPAYQVEIDFGALGIRKSSAQIADLYSKEELVGTQIVAIVNFPKKQIANFFSECLIMGIYGENREVTILTSKNPVTNGSVVG